MIYTVLAFFVGSEGGKCNLVDKERHEDVDKSDLVIQ